MKAEIFQIGINWFIDYFKEDGTHMDYCGEWVSGFESQPLKEAIKRANFWECKSICIIF